jgi:lysophospholipase L1-like esterase
MNNRMGQTRRITLGFLLLVVFTAGAVAEHATIPTLRRLVFVGDSITCGVGVKNRNAERYSAVVTRLLQKKYPGIQEINLGKSGQALCQQPENYAESILAQKPDAVVIQWGVNDHYWGFSDALFFHDAPCQSRTLHHRNHPRSSPK